MPYKINEADYQKYVSEMPNNKVDLIWCDIIANLPDHLKKEAKEKGYTLVENANTAERTDMVIEIYGASSQLTNKLKNMNKVVLVKSQA